MAIILPKDQCATTLIEHFSCTYVYDKYSSKTVLTSTVIPNNINRAFISSVFYSNKLAYFYVGISISLSIVREAFKKLLQHSMICT